MPDSCVGTKRAILPSWLTCSVQRPDAPRSVGRSRAAAAAPPRPRADERDPRRRDPRRRRLEQPRPRSLMRATSSPTSSVLPWPSRRWRWPAGPSRANGPSASSGSRSWPRSSNAVLLFGVAAFVLFEGIQRLSEPPEIATGLMLSGCARRPARQRHSPCWILHRAQRESLNMRGAYLEVLGDLAGSVAVIVAADRHRA